MEVRWEFAVTDETDDPLFPLNTFDAAAMQVIRAHAERTKSIAATSWITQVPFQFAEQAIPSLTVTSIIIPEGSTPSGLLVKSTSEIWKAIVQELGQDWNLAYKIPPYHWEEIVAGAFKNQGYDEVILTPRSGDQGRDIIAIKRGIGSVKVLGSVKAYAPDRIVPYDAVRSLMGVVASERDASKGIITTTSSFPPKIESDPLIAPLLPTRIELVDGAGLQAWLRNLSES